ncbi:nucleoredoxin-like protein 2 [Eurytemora carolleeae]|uniref:nucleoredoxin-like protein 2 n=1 Tax=Eurytemora carolleeae TaxID=1294199 RepID=UPI000C76F248|nr:nucleoredoxin-like protein 2 [Eurytemora carolleeae]|eukprot:XP_023349779.1 nucleoredoxin-like protein 2 [Eurytemora affinis]
MDCLTGQQLLKKDGTVVSADSALADKKIIGFYFSAHWCPPCRLFTPALAEFYTDLVSNGEPFEIIFISSDNSPEELMTYMKESHGDWLAVQHGTVLSQDLKKKFQVSGIPTLIILNRDNDLITKTGRSEVTEKGPLVFQKWLAASK